MPRRTIYVTRTKGITPYPVSTAKKLFCSEDLNTSACSCPLTLSTQYWALTKRMYFVNRRHCFWCKMWVCSICTDPWQAPKSQTKGFLEEHHTLTHTSLWCNASAVSARTKFFEVTFSSFVEMNRNRQVTGKYILISGAFKCTDRFENVSSWKCRQPGKAVVQEENWTANGRFLWTEWDKKSLENRNSVLGA